MTPTPSATATAVPAGAPSAAAALAHRPFDLTGAVLDAWPDIAGDGWLATVVIESTASCAGWRRWPAGPALDSTTS